MKFNRCLLTACLGSMLFCSLLVAQQSRSSSLQAQGPPFSNPVQKENRQPGTTAWQLSNPAEAREIEGYASLTSVPVGGNISLFVNTADATYSLTVYRMGWYGGTGGRRVQGPQVLAGVQQITPTPDPTTGFVECQWTNPFTIHVPTSWLSGIYLVKLHGNTSGKESYIIFTVRDSRPAALVFQQTVNTYQAYNPWPGSTVTFGDGHSLYNDPPVCPPGTSPGNNCFIPQVSFNRPYGQGPGYEGAPDMFYSHQISGLYGIGAGDFLHNVGPTVMEFGMLRWLEHEGYDVTYITDVDTHEDIGRVLRGKAFLSVGHDEYWSEEMRANIVQARDAGVSLGFFGGNYIFWPGKLLPDSGGSPNRTLAVDKTHGGDGEFGGSLVDESEQLVVGGKWVGSVPTNGDIVVNADAPLDHWIFANTGLKVGDVIPGLIGVEYNWTDLNSPTPTGLQILLHTQAPRFENDGIVASNGGFRLPDNFNEDFNGWYDSWVSAGYPLDTTCDTSAIPPRNILPPAGFCRNPRPVDVFSPTREDWAMTIYQASSGAWVFNNATNQWSWGLDDYFTGLKTADGANNGPAFRIQCGYPWFHPGLVSCRNSAIEQITRNVLNKFIGLP